MDQEKEKQKERQRQKDTERDREVQRGKENSISQNSMFPYSIKCTAQ